MRQAQPRPGRLEPNRGRAIWKRASRSWPAEHSPCCAGRDGRPEARDVSRQSLNAAWGGLAWPHDASRLHQVRGSSHCHSPPCSALRRRAPLPQMRGAAAHRPPRGRGTACLHPTAGRATLGHAARTAPRGAEGYPAAGGRGSVPLQPVRGRPDPLADRAASARPGEPGLKRVGVGLAVARSGPTLGARGPIVPPQPPVRPHVAPGPRVAPGGGGWS